MIMSYTVLKNVIKMHCQVKSYYLFELLFANSNFKAQGQVFFNFTDLICGSAFIAKFCIVK